MRRMSETQTMTQQQQQGARLAIAELRTVKWVASQPLVKQVYDAAKPRYLTLKQAAIIGWFIILYEVILVWWWTFIHNLPLPVMVLSLLQQADSLTVRVLDFSQQRLEWWWDASGVRLMWLRESFLVKLDKYITFIDGYLLRLQDIFAPFFTILITPIRIIYEYLNVNPKSTSRPLVSGKADSLRQGMAMEGEKYGDEEYEDWGEDYLSDASTDSKRLLKNDPQGQSYNRLRTTVTAEGKLRAAMYHRVKKELGLMRKNSIRFSCGIVNYARQMMEPRMRPYAESFQVSCQKWAREYEITDMTAPLQEEWNSDKRFLAKALALARALCVVYLAFLLRLVKGKKNRRTRSMRSESLRRRAQNMTCNNSSHPLSPSALQQSSEPTPSPPLEVPASLQEPALREEEEDLDDSPSKNNALANKKTPAYNADSDRTISPIEEELSDVDVTNKKENDHDASEGSITSFDESSKDSGFSDKKSEDEDPVLVKQPKKGVTIMTPTSPGQTKNKNKKIGDKKLFSRQ
ncbi:uncharacterized protein LOC121872724 isoform X2 [Homarus americanus]|nr:uncharacterized protein LOC121872724 isoform X2 [Homarus americanus]